jgi:hypothetical protein
MTAIHILKLQHVTATIKVFEADDLIELSCRCLSDGCPEWSEMEAFEEWELSVCDFYRDDPRRIELHRKEEDCDFS